MIDNKKEYILCAAIRRKYPREVEGGDPYAGEQNDILNIEIGYRHHDIYQRFNVNSPDCPLELGADGFYTSKGRFVDRYEGMEVAYKAGQVGAKKALDKSWHDRGLHCFDERGNLIDWHTADTHAYNMLVSEDLY